MTILSFFSTGADEEEGLACKGFPSGRDVQMVELGDRLPYLVREKGEYCNASHFGDVVLY